MINKYVIDWTKTFSYLQPREYLDLVRLGGQTDGGYVVNSCAVKESQVLLSFGLGPDFSFEQDFVKMNPNSKVFVYDHTISKPTLKYLVSRTLHNLLYRNIKRIELDYSYYKQYKEFFSKDNVKHLRRKISDSQFFAIDIDTTEIMLEHIGEKIFLKIDIEGDEYKALTQIYDHLESIQGMVIEFHNLGYTEPLLREILLKLENHFEISHIHPNNYSGISGNGMPDYMEVTLINKRLREKNKISTDKLRKKLPIDGLDFPNGKKYPQFEILL